MYQQNEKKGKNSLKKKLWRKKKPCWRMLEDVCYGKKLEFPNLHTCKENAGEKHNLESQRTSTEHNK
jgi:hypothetical protein